MNRLQCESSTQGGEYRVEYALERPFAKIEFRHRTALIQFVRESLPPGLTLDDQASTTEVAAFAARRHWTLIEFDGTEAQVTELLQSALNTIHKLLTTTELNMDDLEDDTRQEIQNAAEFENLAARMGFARICSLRTTMTHRSSNATARRSAQD